MRRNKSKSRLLGVKAGFRLLKAAEEIENRPLYSELVSMHLEQKPSRNMVLWYIIFWAFEDYTGQQRYLLFRARHFTCSNARSNMTAGNVLYGLGCEIPFFDCGQPAAYALVWWPECLRRR